MSAPEPAGPAWTPTFPAIRRLDELWYQAERLLCGGMFLLMALMVFGSMVQESFGGGLTPTSCAVIFGLSWLGVLTRRVDDGKRRPDLLRGLLLAAAVSAVVAGLVLAVCWWFEGRSIMVQKLALVMMIWVALLGASMATYERSHLSLEMGEKLWPARVLPFVKAFAHGVTAAFCVAAALLSIELVLDQRTRGIHIEDNDWLEMWQAFVIAPYAFAAMTVRFLAQAVTQATGTSAPVEEKLPS
ncbi:MAG TPA: TRAP transporter small permease [Kofleriaceae bacterium]|jgi:TRAP-type C4-dicarboxylate transport system permease small subunit|nr:TRAP transporter small permease [Kofleriaceae bacterium]